MARRLVAVAALAALTLVPCAGPLAAADRIVTRTGTTFTGRIVRQDPFKVVIETEDGRRVTVTRENIESLREGEDTGSDRPVPIVAAPVFAERADEALAEALAAYKDGQWRQAGALFEGLLGLPDEDFDRTRKLGCAKAAAVCHLRNIDPAGAARNFVRAAGFSNNVAAKPRMVATAEALRQADGPRIDDTVVKGWDDALEAGAKWKADQILQEARIVGLRCRLLYKMERCEKSLEGIRRKLQEADAYVPGYSRRHLVEAFAGLTENIVAAGRKTVQWAGSERAWLTEHRMISMAGRQRAEAFNKRLKLYDERRRAALDALQNLSALSTRHGLGSTFSESDRSNLVATLEDYQYYEGTKDKIEPRGVISHRGWGRYPNR